MSRRFLLALCVVACPAVLQASTPGDAAYRGGHFVQAADLYRKGAEQGDAVAARKLGLMLHAKEVTASDYGAAITWFARACELKDVVSCHNAGVAYEYGGEQGNPEVSVDYEKAGQYYLRAAERGYMQSQYNLGSLYANEHLIGDSAGLVWLLIAQKSAGTCKKNELCKWISNDPPGHVARLRSRMPLVDQKEAEVSAARWKAQK